MNHEEHTAVRYGFGPFTLVPERQLLERDGIPLRIGSRAFELLATLVERPGEIVEKHELIARVWPTTTVGEANLKVNMAALRRVLGTADDATPYIATIPGRGYRFVATLDTGALDEVEPISQPPPRSLPGAVARLIGREPEIAEINQDLQRSRLLSLVGAGGVGKTTVAIAAANTAADSFPHGVFLADFAPLSDPGMVPATIAAALGLPSPTAAALDAVCDQLRELDVLLMFDNCEHVVDAAAECAARLLSQTSRVKIIATSREPLGVGGERVRMLQGLDAPPVSPGLTAADAVSFPAVQLFAERAAERVQTFVLRDEDAPVAADICRRLDGLALAIELAASRIDVFSPSGILKQLEDRIQFLRGRRAGPERQRTMTATLDWSFGLLPPDEAEILQLVSIFAGNFGVEDAAAIAGIPDVQASEALAQLAAKSLLMVDLPAGEIVYRTLETTKLYCRERLREGGRLGEVQARHARYLCEVLGKAVQEWENEPAGEWGARYGRYLHDLRLALRALDADRGDKLLLVNLTAVGTCLWNHLSLTDECRSAVVRAIAVIAETGLLGTAIEMNLQTFLGASLLFTDGPCQEGEGAALRALKIAGDIGDFDFYLRNLWILAGYEVLTGRPSSARARMDEFEAVAQEKDPSALGDCAAMMSAADFSLGRLEIARDRVEPRFQPDVPGLSSAKMARFLFETNGKFGINLGMYQWVTGRPDTAALSTEAVIRQALETGHELTIATVLVSSACPVAIWRHDYAQATHYLQMLDKLVERHGLTIWRPNVLHFRGVLACEADGRLDEGIALMRRSLAGQDAIGHKMRVPHFLGQLAEALIRAGRVDEAASAIADALDRAERHSDLWCVPELKRVHALVLMRQGRAREARALLLDAIAHAEAMGARGWQLRAASDLVRLDESVNPHAVLAPVLAWFNEGLETRDLKLASELVVRAG